MTTTPSKNTFNSFMNKFNNLNKFLSQNYKYSFLIFLFFSIFLYSSITITLNNLENNPNFEFDFKCFLMKKFTNSKFSCKKETTLNEQKRTIYTSHINNPIKNNLNKGKIIVIGIGGISRSGKTTITNKLKPILNPIKILAIDEYGIGPIRKFDEKIKDYVDDWECPEVINLDKFENDLKNLKENFPVKPNEVKYVIAEGYLLYNRKEISDLIDLKFNYFIDKEIARERRKNTKFYTSDYYFDEYIWGSYFDNK